MNVPRHLQGKMGKTKIKRSLKTDSLTVANQRKWSVINDLKREIREAGNGSILDPSVEMGLEMRDQLQRAKASGSADNFESAQAAYDALIDMTLGDEIISEDEFQSGDYEHLYDPERERATSTIIKIVNGELTPLDHLYQQYLAELQVTPRTIADDKRVMAALLRWCHKEHISPAVQSIDRKTAFRFRDGMAETMRTAKGSPGPSKCNSYISCLSRFWKWLVNREEAETNIWQGVKNSIPKQDPKQEPRAYTREEFSALLQGPATPQMADLIRVAALTGARLDAIIKLRVQDIQKLHGVRCFVFAPQKKEKASRPCPVHPDLMEIVTRRTEGKPDDASLWPEWPPVKRQGSLREHSFKASKDFTKYRRRCGVGGQQGTRSTVDFHSFRRWFITEAERAGVPPSTISAVVGHKREGMTLGLYSAGPSIQQAKACVEAVVLPGND